MNEIEFQWLTGPLAGLLTGKGVFVASAIIAAIFIGVLQEQIETIVE